MSGCRWHTRWGLPQSSGTRPQRILKVDDFGSRLWWIRRPILNRRTEVSRNTLTRVGYLSVNGYRKSISEYNLWITLTLPDHWVILTVASSAIFVILVHKTFHSNRARRRYPTTWRTSILCIQREIRTFGFTSHFLSIYSCDEPQKEGVQKEETLHGSGAGGWMIVQLKPSEGEGEGVDIASKNDFGFIKWFELWRWCNVKINLTTSPLITWTKLAFYWNDYVQLHHLDLLDYQLITTAR